jgi:hypothetical protein
MNYIEHESGYRLAMAMMRKKVDYYLDNLENSGMSEQSKKEMRKILQDIFETTEFDYEEAVADD